MPKSQEPKKGSNMLSGHLVAGGMVLIDGTGLPIVETEPPAPMDGYTARYSWQSGPGAITQIWEMVPETGTVTEAMERLAKMNAMSLPDNEALEVVALFPKWHYDTVYSAGTKVQYEGKLYKCLQDHTSQKDWTPNAAPSLWAEVLPGQDGKVGQWLQPDSTNGYRMGDVVTHNGKRWKSTADNNVWEPGSTGAPWQELAANTN